MIVSDNEARGIQIGDAIRHQGIDSENKGFVRNEYFTPARHGRFEIRDAERVAVKILPYPGKRICRSFSAYFLFGVLHEKNIAEEKDGEIA
jgi:hypothetical protein